MSALTSMLRRLGRKARAPRVARDAILFLFEGSSVLGAVQLVDESASGARVESATPEWLEKASIVLNPLTAEAHKVALAWRTGGVGGFRYLDTVRLRGFVDPEFEAVRTAWEKLVIEQPDLARAPLAGRGRLG